MYETGLTALGGAAGGAGGAGLGALGRSPLLDLLAPLDYPRQALWNLARGPARLLSGEGDWQDVLGMAPGLVGALAAGPLGLLGGALAGGAAQGLGRATGSGAFEASRPEDVTGSQDFLPNLLLGAATDPLTYTGLGAGRSAGKGMAIGLGNTEADATLAARRHILADRLPPDLAAVREAQGWGLARGSGAVPAEVPGASRLRAGQPDLIDLLNEPGLARAGGMPDRGVPLPDLIAEGTAALGPQALPALQRAGLQGLGARNQALGEVVGDVARNRVEGLGRQTGDLAAALEARPEALLSRGALTPEEAFAQMLPDYERLQKTRAAELAPRNAFPEGLAGAQFDVGPAEAGQLFGPGLVPGRTSTRDLSERLGENLVVHTPEDVQQLSRYAAVRGARQAAQRALEERWGPAAAQLAGSPEAVARLQGDLATRWGQLGDQLAERNPALAEALPRIEGLRREEGALPWLLEGGAAMAPRTAPVKAGYEQASDYLGRALAAEQPAGPLGPRAGALRTALEEELLGAPWPGRETLHQIGVRPSPRTPEGAVAGGYEATERLSREVLTAARQAERRLGRPLTAAEQHALAQEVLGPGQQANRSVLERMAGGAGARPGGTIPEELLAFGPGGVQRRALNPMG